MFWCLRRRRERSQDGLTGALIGALEAFGDSVAFVDENWDCAMGRRDGGGWATAPN